MLTCPTADWSSGVGVAIAIVVGVVVGVRWGVPVGPGGQEVSGIPIKTKARMPIEEIRILISPSSY
jgi:hypothetical protein